MNLRSFTMAILISALPLSVKAGTRQISLGQGDFVSARTVNRAGGTLVRAKLSKSGRAKFRRLNQESADQEVHTEIGGVQSDLKLRTHIQGSGLEMGPFSETEAQTVADAINRR